MKERLIRFCILQRKLVIALFLTAFVACGLLQFGVKTNYHMADYLPPDAESTRALAVMKEEFSSAQPNARVMVRNVTIPEALEYKARISAIPGASDVMWLDDAADLTIPLSALDSSLVDSYYKDKNAAFMLTVAASMETPVINALYDIVGEEGAVSGEAAGSAAYQGLSSQESTRAFFLLVPAILIILTLSTTSWLEPLLFLFSIGVAVVLNMGTNLIFGSVSYITYSVSPILQLAVSLDYAVFLLHSFEKHRALTPDVETAMADALRESFSSVMASALTTLFGFLALTLMRFRLGSDLGINLVKGIFFSMLGALVFLPALTVCSVKYLDRLRHRSFMPSFQKLGGMIIKLRVPVLTLALLSMVPAYLAQSSNAFTYGTGELDRASRAGQDEQAIIDVFGRSNPMVILVPRGQIANEAALCEALEALPDVVSVMSYVTSVGKTIPTAYLTKDIVSTFYSEHYARIILYADTAAEGEAAFALVEDVRALAQAYYGPEALTLGQSMSLYDIKQVITTDNLLVNLLAVLAISLVLLITFRSVSLPVALVATIETAIWINLSWAYFKGMSLNYVGYLVISTVQLGATVDYAILFTDHYLVNRRSLMPKAAGAKTADETMGSILISGSILSIAGFLMGFVSTNEIVQQMGMLIFRGTLLSLTMALLFLPAALTLCDTFIQKTTRNTRFFPGERNESI